MKSNVQYILWGIVWASGLSLVSCGESSSPAPTYPKTCKEIQTQFVSDTGKRPADGTYTLYFQGKNTKPWEAFCRSMNLTSPKEYLTVDENKNYSEISITASAGATTSYRRYRINPATLKIDPLDDTFAATDGDASVIPDDRSSIPAGWAQFGSGASDGGSAAHSKVNLSGTPFVFSESILANNLADFFCTIDDGGDSSSSGASVSADLSAFTVTAVNTIVTNRVRTVADCDHLSGVDNPGTTDFTAASWPLQYVAQ